MASALSISALSPSSVNATPPAESKTSTHDGLSAFMSVRHRLFGIAYRMLRSAAEAEDVVQDVWVRWQTADRSVVRDAAAFLATTTTRLAINVMQSARSRRERYVGPQLPESFDPGADPAAEAERREGLEAAILLLLEKLSPSERAAYILREAFDYTYRDIANALRLEEANARQVVTRARQHVANGRRMSANSTEGRRLLDRFIAAIQTGDIAGLEEMFGVGRRRASTQQRVSIAPRVVVHGPAVRCPRAAASGARPTSSSALVTPLQIVRATSSRDFVAQIRHNVPRYLVSGSGDFRERATAVGGPPMNCTVALAADGLDRARSTRKVAALDY
jgi:RNA polymerase sigma-70 factor (ECF subfamily)